MKFNIYWEMKVVGGGGGAQKQKYVFQIQGLKKNR